MWWWWWLLIRVGGGGVCLTVEAVVDAVNHVFGGRVQGDELALILLQHRLLGLCCY